MGRALPCTVLRSMAEDAAGTSAQGALRERRSSRTLRRSSTSSQPVQRRAPSLPRQFGALLHGAAGALLQGGKRRTSSISMEPLRHAANGSMEPLRNAAAAAARGRRGSLSGLTKLFRRSAEKASEGSGPAEPMAANVPSEARQGGADALRNSLRKSATQLGTVGRFLVRAATRVGRSKPPSTDRVAPMRPNLALPPVRAPRYKRPSRG